MDQHWGLEGISQNVPLEVAQTSPGLIILL